MGNENAKDRNCYLFNGINLLYIKDVSSADTFCAYREIIQKKFGSSFAFLEIIKLQFGKEHNLSSCEKKA